MSGRGRVLVVDDEPALRTLYSAILEDEGYDVRLARDGREALDQVQEATPDLVVTDIVMPDLTGVELLRAVRRRDLDLPVILVTGSPTIDTAVEAIDLGAIKYLVKPFEGEELARAAKQATAFYRLAKLKREALALTGANIRVGSDRAGLEATFQQALETLWMAYQPILDAKTGQLHGYEALLRTDAPGVGNPAALLDLAARVDGVERLGRAVRKSVAENANFDHAVFVNLHPVDLMDDELVATDAPLTAHAAEVVLEITERAPLAGLYGVGERVRRLRDVGFRIAIDDLGAGYAGLTSFASLEPDVVKLDMSLVRGADAQPLKRQLIASMTSLCNELGIVVVAEGIETASEKQVVCDLGCDLLQGYFFGRPSRVEDLPAVRQAAEEAARSGMPVSASQAAN